MILPDADLTGADAMVNAGLLGRRTLHGHQRVCRGGPIADDLVAKIAERAAPSRPATAPATPTWARWSPRRTATRWPSYIDAGEADGAKIVVDGRTCFETAARTDSGWVRR